MAAPHKCYEENKYFWTFENKEFWKADLTRIRLWKNCLRNGAEVIVHNFSFSSISPNILCGMVILLVIGFRKASSTHAVEWNPKVELTIGQRMSEN